MRYMDHNFPYSRYDKTDTHHDLETSGVVDDVVYHYFLSSPCPDRLLFTQVHHPPSCQHIYIVHPCAKNKPSSYTHIRKT